MDISIIIVNWNTKDFLAQCLRSVYETIKQPTFEIIVVDNASGDGSVAMLQRQFPSVVMIENTTNRGFGAANNQALRIMRGRYALLINTDTVLTENAVSELFSFLEAHPDAAMVGGQLLNADGSKQNSIAAFPSALTLLTNLSLLEYLFPQRFPGKRYAYGGPVEIESAVGACLLVRKRAIDEVGMFDERYFFFFEETDWAWQMKRSGWRIYHVPTARIYHFQGQSIGRDIRSRIEFYRSRYQFFRKWRSRPYVLFISSVIVMRLLVNVFFIPLANICTLCLQRGLRDKWFVYVQLLLWHVRGCPPGKAAPSPLAGEGWGEGGRMQFIGHPHLTSPVKGEEQGKGLQQSILMPDNNLEASRRALLRDAQNMLVIQLGDIGDVVWATPTFRALKEACPQARISVLVREGSGALLEADPHVDGIFEVVKQRGHLRDRIAGSLKLIRSLRQARFDVVFDLRADERGAAMAFLSGAPARCALSHDNVPFWRNRVFTHLVDPPYAPQRVRGAAEQSLRIIREFGVEAENAIPRLWISDAVQGRVRGILEQEHLDERGWVTLNPFSRWAYKEWKGDGWARIIDWLWEEYRIASVLVGSAAERPRAEKLAAACRGKLYNLAGRTTLAELAGLLGLGRLHIGVDSAAPHIAAAVGTPTLTIFGPSDWQDWAPIGDMHRVIVPERECVPCHRKGCDGLGISRCLDDLDPEKVQRGIAELLSFLPASMKGSGRE